MTIPLTTPDAPNLCVLISLPLPEQIASRLPDPREGVCPHITVAGPCDVTEDQARVILEAFNTGAITTGAPIKVKLNGVGDFRNDDLPLPVVFLQVDTGRDELVAFALRLDTEFGLARRFEPHPHVTLAWRNRDLTLAEGEAELDRITLEHLGFVAECELSTVTVQFGVGTDTVPRVNTWNAGRAYNIA